MLLGFIGLLEFVVGFLGFKGSWACVVSGVCSELKGI